ncbi:MAG: cytochrome P450 [Streptomyces sp.]|uniref:cytochrome P450 n=1 Tax=Streptomyces sp. TaxID=1931 RepID=UPI003D6C48B4
MGLIEQKLFPGKKAEDIPALAKAETEPTIVPFFADHDIMVNPYPLYQRLLRDSPVHELGDSVVLMRYADVSAALRHPKVSSDDAHGAGQQSRIASGELPQNIVDSLGQRSFLHRDPPDHTRLRGVVSEMFTPRRIERLRPLAQRLVDEAIEATAGRGEIELIEELAYPLPIKVVCELLGIPAKEHLGEVAWKRSQLCCDFEAPASAGACVHYSAGVQDDMTAYFSRQIEAKRGNPGDDLLTLMLEAEQRGEISESEINDTCRLMVVAGHETTISLITNGLLALLRSPDQLELLRTRPELATGAVEETLRYDSPIQFTRRVAAEDLEINGTRVRRGTTILLWLAAANRDPERFTDPDRFDITRPDSHQHLEFGGGIHYCLGAPLARMQGEVALATLVRRLVNPELTLDPPIYMPDAVHAIQAMTVKFTQVNPAS